MAQALATVEGMAKFKARIQRIPGRTRAAMTAALEEGADELVAMMQRLAPVAHVDGGQLRDSIKREWTTGAQGDGATERGAQLSAKGDAGLAITISAGDKIAYYARWVEHGTAQQPAHPFFFPSYRALKKRISARINRAMRKSLVP